MKNKKIYKLAIIDENFEDNELKFVGFRKSAQIEHKYQPVEKFSLKERNRIEKIISKKSHERKAERQKELESIEKLEEQCKLEFYCGIKFPELSM